MVGYVLRTRDYRLKLGGHSGKEKDVLVGYVDSSFAEDKKRKSRTGGAIFYQDSLIYSCSSRQKLVAHSSAEAEYIGLDDVATTAVYVRQLLATLDELLKEASKMYEDNQSAIIMAQGSKMHTRTKHIDLRYHAIRGYVKEGLIRLEHFETGEMTADTLIKPLGRRLFEKFRDALGILSYSRVGGVMCMMSSWLHLE